MIDFRSHPLYPADIIEEHTYALATRGFTALENFLTPEECAYYKARLEVAVAGYTPRESARSHLDKYHLHDLLCRDVAFARQLEDPRLEQVVTAALDKCWVLYAYTTSSLPPQGTNYGSRLHVDSPRLIPGYPTNIGLLWALDDFTTENGGTWLLAGSHHDSRVPTESYFNRYATQVTCKQGTLLVFNARTWHRAGENRTAQWRHSLTMNVCRPYMKQRMDWVRFIPTNISDQLNAQARRIIGFDTRLPTSLDEFFVPDSERLYKPGQE